MSFNDVISWKYCWNQLWLGLLFMWYHQEDQYLEMEKNKAWVSMIMTWQL